jgi:hypothetical protein
MVFAMPRKSVRLGGVSGSVVLYVSGSVVEVNHGRKYQLLHCRDSKLLVDVCAWMFATALGVSSSTANKCTDDRSCRSLGRHCTEPPPSPNSASARLPEGALQRHCSAPSPLSRTKVATLLPFTITHDTSSHHILSRSTNIHTLSS